MSANTRKTDRKRKAPRTAFKPGESGNPTGRPKLSPEEKAQELELVAACKARSLAALQVIEGLMTTADRDSVKLQAAQFIIERGWGKAVQMTELTGKDGGSIKHNITVEFIRP